MNLDFPPPLITPSATDALPIPARVLRQILSDPVLLGQLCDRVQALLREDLKHQRERHYGYGRRF